MWDYIMSTIPIVVFLAGPDSVCLTGDAKTSSENNVSLSNTSVVNVKKAKKKKKNRQRANRDNQEGEEDVPQFSYSVSYFTWAVSDEEDDTDDECPNITLPIKRK